MNKLDFKPEVEPGMRKLLILASSLVLVLIGVLIEDRGLAMDVTRAGEVVYPVSSGSEDGFAVKLGSLFYVVSLVTSAIGIVRRWRDAVVFAVYSLNSAIFFALLFLVMLDSSIVDAARLGDWLPLAATMICLLSFPIYGLIGLGRWWTD